MVDVALEMIITALQLLGVPGALLVVAVSIWKGLKHLCSFVPQVLSLADKFVDKGINLNINVNNSQSSQPEIGKGARYDRRREESSKESEEGSEESGAKG